MTGPCFWAQTPGRTDVSGPAEFGCLQKPSVSRQALLVTQQTEQLPVSTEPHLQLVTVHLREEKPGMDTNSRQICPENQASQALLYMLHLLSYAQREALPLWRFYPFWACSNLCLCGVWSRSDYYRLSGGPKRSNGFFTQVSVYIKYCMLFREKIRCSKKIEYLPIPLLLYSIVWIIIPGSVRIVLGLFCHWQCRRAVENQAGKTPIPFRARWGVN